MAESLRVPSYPRVIEQQREGAFGAHTLPNGTIMTSEQSDLNAEEYWPDMEGLNYRDTVTDFALAAGTFFDCAAVHLLTTATLNRLRDFYPQGRFEVRRFRPDMVVETANGEKDFVENAWIGQVLAIGDAVRLLKRPRLY